jgi:hypothetical protein
MCTQRRKPKKNITRGNLKGIFYKDKAKLAYFAGVKTYLPKKITIYH